MSSFTSPLDVREADDGNHWKLLTEFDYERGLLGSGDIIRVPAGFITDFASVPKILWNILPPIGLAGKAAVIHDWLYAGQQFSRAETDGIYLEAMAALGVGWAQRYAMYAGVRLGGWVAWKEHQKRGDPDKIKAGALPEFPEVKFSIG